MLESIERASISFKVVPSVVFMLAAHTTRGVALILTSAGSWQLISGKLSFGF